MAHLELQTTESLVVSSLQILLWVDMNGFLLFSLAYVSSATHDLLACVASVSVRFTGKERVKRSQDREKSGASKRARRGWGRKGTNPEILKTTHLACHAWVRTPTFDAVINCHYWPIKCLAFRGAEMNFRGRVCETKIFFFLYFGTRGRR